MVIVHVCLPLSVPAARAWDVIARFDSLADWHPDVATSAADGQDLGAVRQVIMKDGTLIGEKLVHWDAAARHYRYTLTDHPMPVDDYTGEMTVVETTPGHCRLEWRATFRPRDDAQAGDIARDLGAVFALGLANIAESVYTNGQFH